MAKKAAADHFFTKKHLQTLKDNADKINSVMNKLHGNIPTWEQYQEFLFLFEKHLPFHSFMKKTVDFLDEENLKLLLPFFKDARLYTEDVYSNTERFFISIAKEISKETAYNENYLTCLTQEEFEKYILNRKLPEEKILKDRFLCSALYFKKGERQLLLGNDVELLEEKMTGKDKSKETLIGTIAYQGTARGIVRVVLDPHKVKEFNKGDILVTGMTRPEFLSVVEKSSAIVTDVGGMLCHAAIVARELKKPCIIGTKIATKVLKDGDLIEVDADNGVVKIIRKFK